MSIKRMSRRPRRNSGIARGLLAGLIGALALDAGAAVAETPEEKGLAIAEEADRRDLGFGDSATVVKMVLSNRHGETSTRELRINTLEVPDPSQGDKSLTVFDHPRDIKGTAFLSFTHIVEADDQWLYLPALKRVKRISSSNKSGPFMGSEFAYEDLSSQEVSKYTYRWLRDEPCGDLQCFVIEQFPVYEHSGYTRQILWMDQAEYRPIKIEFYDRKNDVLKTLTFSDYRHYLDKYWRAHKLFVENHQTGKTTTLEFESIELQVGLNERDFNSAALKRAR
ncbi:MAG: outer membrane lipoprotein-sorting protein [Alphaproteobacteria bacterium]|jgi:hypothetical protein|nr:outer membrane lipoprotein-sorting protein [Alphaproteobacteria bacterium]MDP6517549.1 outer membrane lipoprotein-sorting protein [Alphaproteobacteria bacterium]